MVKGVICGFRGQRRNIKSRADGGDGGDTGCEAEANIPELAQFFHKGINLACALRVEDGFCVVKEQDHFP